MQYDVSAGLCRSWVRRMLGDLSPACMLLLPPLQRRLLERQAVRYGPTRTLQLHMHTRMHAGSCACAPAPHASAISRRDPPAHPFVMQRPRLITVHGHCSLYGVPLERPQCAPHHSESTPVPALQVQSTSSCTGSMHLKCTRCVQILPTISESPARSVVGEVSLSSMAEGSAIQGARAQQGSGNLAHPFGPHLMHSSAAASAATALGNTAGTLAGTGLLHLAPGSPAELMPDQRQYSASTSDAVAVPDQGPFVLDTHASAAVIRPASRGGPRSGTGGCVQSPISLVSAPLLGADAILTEPQDDMIPSTRELTHGSSEAQIDVQLGMATKDVDPGEQAPSFHCIPLMQL
jgi:hypothetical protein